ncbi:MAG TPA: hypothetical protein VK932_04190 [Kofleriaceae bacterium]|nr:hypothetical protein [Kofleriaceae bacterium]
MDDDDPGRVTLELPVMRPDAGLDAGFAAPAAEEAGRLPARLRARRVTLPLPPSGPRATAARIVEILRRPQAPGETVEGAFCRRERELAELFRMLPPAEADALLHRLSAPRAGDPIAMGFARLAPARRARLLSYLA